MTKSELLKLLEKIPDNAIVCVDDSYGAFDRYNHFEKDFTREKVLVNGEETWYYVLNTSGDEEGYSKLPRKEVERPLLPENAVKFLKELFPNIGQPLHSCEFELGTWEPKLVGGTQADQEENRKLQNEYWEKLERITGKPREILKELTLGDL